MASPSSDRNSYRNTDSSTADSPWGVARLIALLIGLGTAGCASFANPPKSASEQERTRIAPGIELVVSDSAGPEARRIAAEIQEKYDAELISARPANARRWPVQ